MEGQPRPKRSGAGSSPAGGASAIVAQMEERGPEEAGVGSPNLSDGTIISFGESGAV